MSPLLGLEGTCRLDDLGVIRARGADAATFLQGQLTQDVKGLSDTVVRLAAFCSAKGRMQASFVVWRDGTDDFFLACSRDLLATTLKRLSMFILRARCKLDDVSDEVAIWGLTGDLAQTEVDGAQPWQRRASIDPPAMSTIRLPDAEGVVRAWRIQPASSNPPSSTALPNAAWRWLDVSSGIVTIVAATVDRFVPQMVNYERVGGVDFQKGCYPGQEVVARSQYRGTSKRRAFLFDSDDGAAAPGDDVHAHGETGEPVGTVANAAAWPAGNGSRLLVELRLTAVDAQLRLRQSDGPSLRPVPMPYPLLLTSEADT